jgi:hypothetical protein
LEVSYSHKRETVKGKKEKYELSSFHEVRNTLHGPSPVSAIGGVLIAQDLDAYSELHTFQVCIALIVENSYQQRNPLLMVG